MSKRNPLIIFGSAEIATMARFYFEHDSAYEVVAFTVDDEYVREDTLEGLPVVAFSEALDEFSPDIHAMHVALSYTRLNQLRADKYKQARKSGYKLASYICSKSVRWPDLKIGDNCFILENQTVQPTVTIGNNVMLWSGNHIGHGSVIGDHTYFSSHVVLSGHCTVGQRNFFGVNATIKDFTTIGNDCFIAMGASITQDLADGSVVLGAQSTILPPDDRRAETLKKKYFKL